MAANRTGSMSSLETLRCRQCVLAVLSTAVSVPQRRHRPDGLLYRYQDGVPAAEGQGGGGHPGNRVPSPHRQVGAQGRLLLGGSCWLPSLEGGMQEGRGDGHCKGAWGQFLMETRRVAERCRCGYSKQLPSAGLVLLSRLL